MRNRSLVCSSPKRWRFQNKKWEQKLVAPSHARTEEVGPALYRVPLAASLLRAHVGGRPGKAGPLTEFLLPQGQPEVGHVGLAAAAEEDVGRLDVAVDQPLGMGVVQCLG